MTGKKYQLTNTAIVSFENIDTEPGETCQCQWRCRSPKDDKCKINIPELFKKSRAKKIMQSLEAGGDLIEIMADSFDSAEIIEKAVKKWKKWRRNGKKLVKLFKIIKNCIDLAK